MTIADIRRMVTMNGQGPHDPVGTLAPQAPIPKRAQNPSPDFEIILLPGDLLADRQFVSLNQLPRNFLGLLRQQKFAYGGLLSHAICGLSPPNLEG
jgi:hypothetical protein